MEDKLLLALRLVLNKRRKIIPSILALSIAMTIGFFIIDTYNTKNFILNKIGLQFDLASKTLDEIEILSQTPCLHVLPKLTRRSLDDSFIRSLGFIKQGKITCSSFGGNKVWSSEDIFGKLDYPTNSQIAIYPKKSNMPSSNKQTILIVKKSKFNNENYNYIVIDASQLFSLINDIFKNDEVFYSISIKKNIIYNINSLKTIRLAEKGGVTLNIEPSANYLLRIGIPRFFGFLCTLGVFVFILSLIYVVRPKCYSIVNGIAKRELYNVYQPIFDTDNSIYGAEVLVRWCRDGVHIPPSEFIPEAEKNGQIHQITHYVMEEIRRDVLNCSFIKNNFHLSLNLSPQDLNCIDVISDILKLKGELPINFQLVVEITETAITTNLNQIKKMIEMLRKNEIKIALDDFGTGYNSFSLLNELDVDILKIDKSFIEKIEESNRGRNILNSVISLSEDLSLITIAEGVENIEQLEYLKERNVSLYQGFYFSHPSKFIDLQKSFYSK